MNSRQELHEQVVPHEGLEVGDVQFSDLPEVLSPSNLPEVFSPSDFPEPYHKKEAPEVSSKRLIPRLQRRLLTAVVVILIAVAIALSVVLTNINHSKSTPGQGNSTSNGTFVEGSSLAVTGWRAETDFSIRLFYQGSDDFLRVSSFESSTGSGWTSATKTTKAKPKTPLAAVSFNQSFYGNGSDIETRVFYLDDQNHINELIFDSANPLGKSGTLSERSITTASVSRLAAYWPSLTYQHAANGAIWEVRYNCSTGTVDCWNNKPLNISGLDAGFGVAEVPYGRNLSGIFLFYQRDDNQLINYAWSSEANNWTIRNFAKSVPPSASVAGFSTPRARALSALSFYILWQDTSGDIQMSWMDDTSGWKGPSVISTAFDGVGNGTALACLTPSSWYTSPLQPGTDMSRCYFQANNGKLREVLYNGSDWEFLGNVL